ncbi:DUF5709 domain-containing protein [Actinorugispora endophytica]|uniref:DUF5709 domain-containing protein n=1 Tax=Actinorugispora endophytica TaxID=1605990 RepID=A0A4R6URM3_9ACTN|nr:DUF5709 domain-containing protein [Actinorugispora endophytica]TDQ48253.1 hypothetical protein EV190_11967 [Actinorugispora endophytica]
MAEQRNDRREDPIHALDTDYEDAGQPALEDTTEDFVVPGDEPVAMGEFGTTGTEKEAGEPLDIALSREEPDIWNRAPGTEGDAEADPVAGRLVAEDRGSRPDHEDQLVAEDEGVDSGGFSAEEQAVHEREEP